MEIILLKDVDKVGAKHELVTVKNGYGRNYLIPQGLAIIANKTNRGRLADLRRRETAMQNKQLGHYQEIAGKIEGKTLKIGAKAGTSGKIFGSVTSIQLANALQEQLSVDIDRKLIELPDEVKNLGEYEAILNLHPEVKPKIKFEVVEDA